MSRPEKEAPAPDGAPYLTDAVKGLPLFKPPLSWQEAVRGAGRDAVHVLSLNECPYPPSPRVVEAIRAAAADVNRYPVSRGGDLAQALAERTRILPSRIVFGNGSDELLHLLCVVALRPGDNAVMPTPSFPRYRLATTLLGAEPRLVRLGADGANDADGLLARVDGRTRLLFCCNPNNPSGGFLDEARLARDGLQEPIALAGQREAEEPPDLGFVLDEEDGWTGSRLGPGAGQWGRGGLNHPGE
jgi:histidinol-phosphate/aromatic aminotransferase/cobyric acid decarboxylase-like protein